MGYNYLFVITGPSGCGKTTLLKKMEISHYNKWGCSFWTKADKHSTRLPRVGEKDSVGYSDVMTPDILPTDSQEVILNKKKEKRADIEQHCDIIYYMNNELYGFNTSDILRQLEKTNVAIVLSDLGVIKQLKEEPSYGLTDRIVTLYISSCVNKNELTDVWLSRYCDFIGTKKEKDNYSDIRQSTKDVDGLLSLLESELKALTNVSLSNTPEGYEKFKEFYFSLSKVVELQESLMPDNSSYSVRIERLKNFYFKYIIDIGLFDYVILNYFDERQDDPKDEKMSLQVKNIIDYIQNINTERESKSLPYLSYNSKLRPQDAVFFVCAAPKAGKNILMKNLNVMSEKQIFVIEKQSLRERKRNDGQDKMMPIIERQDGESAEQFEIRKSSILAFIKEADKAYEEHNKNIDSILNSIKELKLRGDDESEYIIEGKEKKLAKEKEEFAEKEELLLTRAISFFGSRFQDWNWRFHGKYYGIDLHTIKQFCKAEREEQNKPVIPVIMISNMQQLRKARELLGDRLIPIFLTFVGTDKSNKQYHYGLVNKGIYKSSEEAESILNEIEEVRQAYFDNIGEFRHVLLNSGIEEDLHDQIINIVRLYGRKVK